MDTRLATFGAGCFWCTEAILEQLDGVLAVEPGYMGGHVERPTYQQICEKNTGHVEVAQVRFDPKKISFDHLLAYFWQLHDPTQIDGQGNDIGPQYRSAIFFHSEEQRQQAETAKQQAQQSGKFLLPIVTEITAAKKFWIAEEYHRNYYQNNREQGYCRAVIAPKLDKLGLQK